jgi:glycine reductase complex component B subunit alpha and beta
MKLELGKIFIRHVEFSHITKIEEEILYINKEELIKEISKDEPVKNIDIELAHPGEAIRIVPVKDVIEPRVKVEGSGGIFPGIISKVERVGMGRTHAIKNVALITAGKIVGFQEGIIDMSGPGALYTPFSQTHNVVVLVEPEDHIEQHSHEALIRTIGLRAAVYLGKAAKDCIPHEVSVYETEPILKSMVKYPHLPRVGYVYMLQTQGLLHDTYVYGIDAKKIIPTFLYPTEIMDGAIVSGNCVSACDKNTTYVHLNNSIIEDLYEKHGKEINFVGVIITNENVYLADKERSSDWTAKLCSYLGLEGVIISQEGFGNPDTDLIMNCKKLEAEGIKTVIITDEYAGRDGASQSLVDAHPKADAVITNGNANEIIVLPPMKKIIGFSKCVDTISGGHNGSLKSDGSIEVEIQTIIGATNEVGFGKLSAKSY